MATVDLYIWKRPSKDGKFPISVRITINRKPSYVKVPPFKTNIHKTVSHRDNNYFGIIYLSAGSGFHFIDYQKHSVSPPVVFFVRSEQVHGFELSDVIEPSGFVLIVKKNLSMRLRLVN